jgi:hypothetical protein
MAGERVSWPSSAFWPVSQKKIYKPPRPSFWVVTRGTFWQLLALAFSM